MAKEVEKKRGWFRRHWIWTTVIVIVGLFILLAIIGGISKSGDNQANQNQQQNNPPSQTPSNNSPVNNQKPQTPSKPAEDYPCPDLSSMKLLRYDSGMQSWIAQISPYKKDNLEVVYTYNSQVEQNQIIIYCDVGSTEGQNADWVYCGDFIRPIVAQYTNNAGIIIKKRSVEITFDKNTNQYLGTKCDTYTLM